MLAIMVTNYNNKNANEFLRPLSQVFRIIATLISHRTVRCASYTLTIVPREFLDPLILKQVSVAYMLHIMSSYFTLPLVPLLDSIRIRKTCLEPNEIERVVVIISPSRDKSNDIYIFFIRVLLPEIF